MSEIVVTALELAGCACHWCCHTFPGKFIGIPFRHAKNKFTCLAKPFCSFGCARAYINKEVRGYLQVRAQSLLPLLYKSMGGSLKRLPRPAPSREALQLFGGPMSIDEYRKVSITDNIRVEVSEAPLEIKEEFVTITHSSGNRYRPRLRERPTGSAAQPAVSARNTKSLKRAQGDSHSSSIMDFLHSTHV
jgi:hypothetical protein